jgi:hypothetical protein
MRFELGGAVVLCCSGRTLRGIFGHFYSSMVKVKAGVKVVTIVEPILAHFGDAQSVRS